MTTAPFTHIAARSLLLSTLVVFGMLAFGGIADALTVSPPTAEFLLEPGVSHSSKIKLYNETQRTQTLYVEIVNFAASGETGVPSYDFDAEKIGFSTWISIPEETIVLEPGASKEVPVLIDTPLTASPGGHYAAVFFSEDAPEEGGQVAIGSKVGTLYLARVGGEVIENGSIAEFTTSQTSFNRLPVDFAVRFQNTGNTHLRPSGVITVKNIFGKASAAIDVNPTKSATLPGQIRKYEAIWEKEIIEEATGNGWSNFWTEFSNEKKNFAFGRYTATVALVSGTNNALSHEANMSFWVLPWHVIVIYLLGLLAIAAVLILVIRQYNSWIIAKAGEVKKESPKRTNNKTVKKDKG